MYDLLSQYLRILVGVSINVNKITLWLNNYNSSKLPIFMIELINDCSMHGYLFSFFVKLILRNEKLRENFLAFLLHLINKFFFVNFSRYICGFSVNQSSSIIFTLQQIFDHRVIDAYKLIIRACWEVLKCLAIQQLFGYAHASLNLSDENQFVILFSILLNVLIKTVLNIKKEEFIINTVKPSLIFQLSLSRWLEYYFERVSYLN